MPPRPSPLPADTIAPGRDDTQPAVRRRRRWPWVALGVVGALAIAALFFFTELEWHDVQRAMMELNTPATIALMAILPLGGFSVSLVYVMAGAKFGLGLGGIVVAGITAFHLLASHGIARGALRKPLERWFGKRRHHLPHIPADDDVAASLLTALVPGIPYVARNYFLALAGVPLRIYFWICLPIYVAHAYTALFLITFAADPGGRRLVALGAIYVVKLGVCAEVIRRIRKRHRHQDAPGWP